MDNNIVVFVDWSGVDLFGYGLRSDGKWNGRNVAWTGEDYFGGFVDTFWRELCLGNNALKVGDGILRSVWGGLWRVLVFGVAFLVGTVIILPNVEGRIVARALESKEAEWLTGQVGIQEDFRQGNISVDEYLRYMLAVGYGTEELPQKYQTDQVEMIPDVLGMIDEYGESLSKETVEMALDAIFATNIEVGWDASGNIARDDKNIIEELMDEALGTKEAQAFTKKATTLNKAALSSGENFIVFYTDVGDDAITDVQASELADMMERIVENYRKNLGLEYSYTFHAGSGGNLKATQEVLRNSGIDENKYETAMAVYVANPYSEETNTLAFYSGEHLAEWKNSVLVSLGSLLGIDDGRWAKSTGGVPNITILSSNLGNPSLELVVAHELGHHYQNLHCQRNFGGQCPSGDFLVETGANWLAINAVVDQPEDNVITGHHNYYINYGTCYSADEVLREPPEIDACHTSGSYPGYPAVAFLQNYYEAVNGSIEKLMDALLVEDSLYYLRQQTTEEEWREAMKNLAQKNLTNDYAEASLWTKETPSGQDLGCESVLTCTKTLPIRSTAAKYMYFSTEEYDHTRVTIKGSEKLMISVLGKKSDASWELIMEGVGSLEYNIAKEGEYDTIAVVVANAEVCGRLFTVELVEQEMEELLAGAIEAEEVDSDEGCTTIDLQEMWEQISILEQSTFGLLGEMGVEVTEEAEEVEEGLSEAKAATDGRKLIVCGIQTKTGVKMAEVERRVQKKLWIKIGTFELDEAKAKVVVGIDEKRKQGKVFLLEEEDGKVYVLEMRVL